MPKSLKRFPDGIMSYFYDLERIQISGRFDLKSSGSRGFSSAADQPHNGDANRDCGQPSDPQRILGHRQHFRRQFPGKARKPAINQALYHQDQPNRRDKILHRRYWAVLGCVAGGVAGAAGAVAGAAGAVAGAAGAVAGAPGCPG